MPPEAIGHPRRNDDGISEGGLSMSATIPHRTLTEEVAEFLARAPSSEDIARYRISEEALERVRGLMDKNADGALTTAESAELDEITVLDQLFTLIRAHMMSGNQPPAQHGLGA